MQKWREKGWEILSRAMTSGWQRVDRWVGGGGGDREWSWVIVVIHKFCIDQPQAYWTSCIAAAFKRNSLKFLDKILRFFVRHRLLFVYLSFHHITVHVRKFPSPSVFTVSDQNLDGDQGTRLGPAHKTIGVTLLHRKRLCWRIILCSQTLTGYTTSPATRD